jgi:lipoprotein-anchoring transpeptidase ErfK/SrfK
MRHRSFIALALVVVLLLAGAVAAYAYDNSREGQIAEGVSVAGVAVGGMRSDDARKLIRRRLQRPLERPLVITHGTERFTLSARDAGVRADVGGMVDEALARSRGGNIISRVARDLTGAEENVEVPARVSYSKAAVSGLVARVGKRLDRPARDARVDFPSLERVRERYGRKLDTDSLERRVEQALVVPGVDRSLRAPVTRVRPKVTQAKLADRYPALLVADRSRFKLRLYKRLKLAKEYTVAVGALGFDTPAGLYHIQNKAVDPAWSVPKRAWAGRLAGRVIPGGVPENPLKARWLGIYDGAGIHGTDETATLGSAASHGCIRMAVPDVIEVYDEVPVGAPIYIA